MEKKMYPVRVVTVVGTEVMGDNVWCVKNAADTGFALSEHGPDEFVTFAYDEQGSKSISVKIASIIAVKDGHKRN
jgi:hypothetical protein